MGFRGTGALSVPLTLSLRVYIKAKPVEAPDTHLLDFHSTAILFLTLTGKNEKKRGEKKVVPRHLEDVGIGPKLA